MLREGATRANRESCKQNAKLKFLVVAHREYDAAMLAVAKNPENLETAETLAKARQIKIRLAKNLDIKPKMNHIALLHKVVFAF